MYEIHKKGAYLPCIKTDRITSKEIKSEMIVICTDYLIEQGLISENSREMFEIFYKIYIFNKYFNSIYN